MLGQVNTCKKRTAQDKFLFLYFLLEIISQSVHAEHLNWEEKKTPVLPAHRTRRQSLEQQQQLENERREILAKRMSRRGNPKFCVQTPPQSLDDPQNAYLWDRVQTALVKLNNCSQISNDTHHKDSICSVNSTKLSTSKNKNHYVKRNITGHRASQCIIHNAQDTIQNYLT